MAKTSAKENKCKFIACCFKTSVNNTYVKSKDKKTKALIYDTRLRITPGKIMSTSRATL